MVYNTNTQTNNIVKGTDFQEAAKEAMFTISEALSRSVGYYGSTTIIENAVTGHKITKDGYTILQSLKFSAEKPIANTILNFIKNISKTLVTEVGDGSTSSVLTSDALFNFIADIEKEDKISPKALLDELEVSRKLIEDSKEGLVRHSSNRVARAIYYWFRKEQKGERVKNSVHKSSEKQGCAV